MATSLPTILVIGATGNTGRGVVHGLSQALEANGPTSPYRVLGLTRTLDTAAAVALARLSHVEMLAFEWTEIDATWLQLHHVVRVFLSHHNPRTMFDDESTFLCACRDAAVAYVVRMSVNASSLAPDAVPYYARAHWAIEALLRSPAFTPLQWTCLGPNYFLTSLLDAFVASVQARNEHSVVRALFAHDAPIVAIHPDDISAVATTLLMVKDPSPHFGRSYNLTGPADFTGDDVRRLIEAKTGETLNVEFASASLLHDMVTRAPKHHGRTLEHVVTQYIQTGRLSLASDPDQATSPEILALGLTFSTLSDYIDRAFA